MSKGNLYTKSERETEYKVTSITDVSNSDLVDSIVLINSADTFITENLKQYSALANYKLISISKENFTKMLGQDGEILILTSDKQELAKFNKEYKEDENGNYTYNFEGIDTNSISIVTTKPVTEGRLVLNYTKNLKGNTNYSKTEISNFEKLTHNAKTDVLIIGGGMAGILCAFYLKQQGVDYMLVESETIGNGITKNTTAKITSQHGLIYYL